MIAFYQSIMGISTPLLSTLLEQRLKRGKEDAQRIGERKGVAGLTRPDGMLYWLHAASVGEAQSALILIRRLLDENPALHILVTTGTRTSAQLMEKSLPERSFHQFYPLDHPDWVKAFLNHWHPDFVLWMESELWPNMLLELKKREVPAALINARLSPTSYNAWRVFGGAAKTVLSAFALILCQTEKAQSYFESLGAPNAHYTDNLKYSAQALKANDADLQHFNAALTNRPCWLYASTHAGEEALALRVHERLKASYPELLTIIVPRHPERRDELKAQLAAAGANIMLRGEDKAVPTAETDLYIADTLGELGLFYRVAPIACIGRSFSDDGGGGHNPIEAAQLHCAILHGPNVQNLQDIFDEMDRAGAAFMLRDRNALFEELHGLLGDEEHLHSRQDRAAAFAHEKTQVIERVMGQLAPLLPVSSRLQETGS